MLVELEVPLARKAFVGEIPFGFEAQINCCKMIGVMPFSMDCSNSLKSTALAVQSCLFLDVVPESRDCPSGTVSFVVWWKWNLQKIPHWMKCLMHSWSDNEWLKLQKL